MLLSETQFWVPLSAPAFNSHKWARNAQIVGQRRTKIWRQEHSQARSQGPQWQVIIQDLFLKIWDAVVNKLLLLTSAMQLWWNQTQAPYWYTQYIYIYLNNILLRVHPQSSDPHGLLLNLPTYPFVTPWNDSTNGTESSSCRGVWLLVSFLPFQLQPTNDLRLPWMSIHSFAGTYHQWLFAVPMSPWKQAVTNNQKPGGFHWGYVFFGGLYCPGVYIHRYVGFF